jgi:flagellar assembly protein FliH
MTARAKFQFDADFGEARTAEVPKITLAAHEAAVAEAEARGYRSGVNAAEAQARTEAERRSAAAFERVSATLNGLVQKFAEIERKLEAEAVEVAVAVAGKLAPALMAREPVGEIAELATNCFAELRHVPHIAVRVSAQDQPMAQELLTRIATANGFEGRLIVMGDDKVAPGDCRIEWADGGIVRDSAAAAALIDEAVKRYTSALKSDLERMEG